MEGQWESDTRFENFGSKNEDVYVRSINATANGFLDNGN